MRPNKNDNFLKPYSQMQDAKRIPTIKKKRPHKQQKPQTRKFIYEPQWFFQPMSYRKVKRNELSKINDSNYHQATYQKKKKTIIKQNAWQ